MASWTTVLTIYSGAQRGNCLLLGCWNYECITLTKEIVRGWLKISSMISVREY